MICGNTSDLIDNPLPTDSVGPPNTEWDSSAMAFRCHRFGDGRFGDEM